MDRKPGHLTKKVEDVSELVWVKIVGIGNSGVGKTCLIKNFCESKFTSAYQPTVGVDYGFKIQNVQSIDLRVHLWDLSGAPEYADVRSDLYNNTDAVFLVYDVTQPTSFESLDTWLREISRHTNLTAEICLVANKSDLKSKRAISTTEGKKWAASHKMLYFETSCQSGENVEKLFDDMLNEVVIKRKSEKTV